MTESEFFSDTPVLRVPPDEGDIDGGNSQKTPIGHMDWGIATFLLILFLSFRSRKSLKKKVFSFAFVGLLFSATVSAQDNPVAKIDNFYFDLGALNHGEVLPLNVLFNDVFVQPFDMFDDGVIEIIKSPTNADLCVVNQAPNMSWQCAYSPRPGFVGVDTLVYRIKNGNQFSSPVNAYIYVYETPDAISSATCYTPPPSIDFAMERVAFTDSITQPVSTASPVLVGNLMGDTAPELLVWGWVDNGASPNDGKTNTLRIFSYDETKPKGVDRLIQQDTILVRSDLTDFGPFVYQNVTIGKANNDDAYASIFVTTTTGKLICFRYDSGGNTGATGGLFFKEIWAVQCLENPEDISGHSFASPILASFSGDGNVQVQVFDKIYNAETGVLLVDGNLYDRTTSRTRAGYHFGQGAGHGRNSVSVIADVDNDGIQELICGDCVYDVTIGNPLASDASNTFVLKIRANLNAYASSGQRDAAIAPTTLGDGGAAVADVNLDGKLDVVVTSRTTASSVPILFVYDPVTGAILSNGLYQGISVAGASGPGMPMVGDLDGNGVPDIAYVSLNKLSAYEYGGGTLVEKYTLGATDGVEDNSASTALTIFDFGMRGKTQIIYKGQTKMTIFDAVGTSLTKMSDFCVNSPTVDEYPVVADLSANSYGPAKIIFTGSNYNCNVIDGRNNIRFRGSLYVAAAAGSSPWAPARSVWNQNLYSPLNINDDMSIPVNPLSQATVFHTADGRVTRPFNGAMYQLTSLNREGDLLYAAPDLTFDTRQNQTFEYKQNTSGSQAFDVLDSLIVNIHIQNTGTAAFSNTLNFQLYKFQTSVQQYHLIKEDKLDNVTLQKYTIADYENGSMNIRFGIGGYNPAVELPGFPYGSYYKEGVKTAIPQGTWLVTINVKENGTSRPASFNNQDECNIDNNFNHAVGFIHADRVLCYKEQTLVQLEPKDSYWCLWYSKDPTDPDITQILDQANPVGGKNAGDIYEPCDAVSCASVIYGDERHAVSPALPPVYDPALASLRGQDHLTLHKNGAPGAPPTPRDTFYVMLYTAAPPEFGGTGVLVSAEAQPIVFHLSPESLKWTGGGSTSDWHNPGNWVYTGSRTGDEAPVPQALIPRSCTNVLIPKARGEGGVATDFTRYPDLTPKDPVNSLIATDYSLYEASCDTIHFEQNAEVNRPDSLHYNSAKVDMELTGGRWYTLSPPLTRMFSGDYYLNNPNPYLDKIGSAEGMFFYMRNWGRLNPQTNKMVLGQWTGAFNTPNVGISAGLGFGGWVDDPNNTTKNTGSYVFPFPKKDASYSIWSSKTTPYSGPYVTDRNQSGDFHGDRFIYEDAADFSPSTGRFTYTFTPSSDAAGVIVLIGNPFMSHIDFDLFYQRNQANIENFFYTIDANGTISSYTFGVGTVANLKYIPPLQGFFVQAKQNRNSVTFDVQDLMVTFGPDRTRNVLRSSVSEETPDLQALVIEASPVSDVSKSTRAYVMINENANGRYVASEDVPRMFMEIASSKEIPTVYTRSSDGYLLEHNRVNGSEEEIIPLGIRMQSTGDYRLTFKGSRLDSKEIIYLHDKLLGTPPVPLHKGATYDFHVKTGDAGADLLIDNRFYLTFNNRSYLSIEDVEVVNHGKNPLRAHCLDGAIYASMQNGEMILSAQLYDLMGRLVRSEKSVNQSDCSLKAGNQAQVYILKVMTEKNTYSVKIRTN